jgi:hypothetical protein
MHVSFFGQSEATLHTCWPLVHDGWQLVVKPPPPLKQQTSMPVQDDLPVHVRPPPASGIPARVLVEPVLELPLVALLALPPIWVLPLGHWGPLAQANVVTPLAALSQHTSDDVHARAPQRIAELPGGLLPVVPLP